MIHDEEYVKMVAEQLCQTRHNMSLAQVDLYLQEEYKNEIKKHIELITAIENIRSTNDGIIIRMMQRDEKTLFENALFEGEVQKHEDHYVWSCQWIGDAGNEEYESHDVVYATICEAKQIIEQLGYITGESYAEHDYAMFKFWQRDCETWQGKE